MSEKHEVLIHIDQKPYHSPNPTDGEALYALGNLKPGLELYREVADNLEDMPIPRSKDYIHLREDEHFHSDEPHNVLIIVNARKKERTSDELTFERVVALSFDPIHPNSLFTFTYSGGVNHQGGSLQPGQK